MKDEIRATPVGEDAIARGQRVAGETVHRQSADGRTYASFRLPLDADPPEQMTAEVEGPAAGTAAPVDVGALADGPSVWEAREDDKA
jgi:hypothetical protein